MSIRLYSNIQTSLVLKKSEFNTYLFRVRTLDEIQTILKDLRKQNPKATHLCTAYRIENKEQASDDGEPSGTAGQPMMDVLRKADVSDILAVVVRYYGGIPLGASGLTKAYRNCVSQALQKAELTILTPVIHLEFEVSLALADLVLSRLPKLGSLVDRTFGETLRIILQSEKDVSETLNALTKGQIRFLSVTHHFIEKKIK